MPKVSVLIPTYNYARFLPEALDSILSQAYQDFEVVISDDASTDNTQEVVAPYLQKDSRIKYVRHEKNLGMVQNWNWTLNQASGEYVQFLFADDKFMDVMALSRFVEALDANLLASFVASARYAIDQSSKIVGVLDGLDRYGLVSGDVVIKDCLLKDKNLVGEPSVVMFRKSLAVRGFDESYRQLVDLEMWFHLCCRSYLFYIKDPLCGFRCHPDQQTVVNSKSQKTKNEGLRLFMDYFLELRNFFGEGLVGRYGFFLVMFIQRKNLIKAMRHDPDLVGSLRFFDVNLPVVWLLVCWVSYRISRPFYNLRSSFKKRKSRFMRRGL